MKKGKLAAYFSVHQAQLQIVLFQIFSFVAFLTQTISRLICDLSLKGFSQAVSIWPFPSQALGSLLAFLISNLLAKTVSFVLNRKKTFKANNNALFSTVCYVIMVLILIIAETIIGTPLQNGLYGLLGGSFTGSILTTASAVNGMLYQVSGTLSQIIYGTMDSIIIFVMDKFIIMRHKEESTSPER